MYYHYGFVTDFVIVFVVFKPIHLSVLFVMLYLHCSLIILFILFVFALMQCITFTVVQYSILYILYVFIFNMQILILIRKIGVHGQWRDFDSNF